MCVQNKAFEHAEKGRLSSILVSLSPHGTTRFSIANTRRRIAGCVDSHSGAVIAWQRSTFIVPELFKFLRHVERQYPNAETIFVVWDNWKAHTHPYVPEALQACGSRIRLLSLPTYAPWLNPMEKVWLKLDQEVLDQHPFGQDWQGLKQAVDQWLQQKRLGSMDLLRFIRLAPPGLPPCTDSFVKVHHCATTHKKCTDEKVHLHKWLLQGRTPWSA